MHADLDVLSEELQRVQAYFLLMFLFRGMPFIDLAHLLQAGRERWQNSVSSPQDGQTDHIAYPREALPLLKEFKDKDETSLYLFPILNAAPEGDDALYECYQKALRNFNKMLRVLAKRLLPGIKISSYTRKAYMGYIGLSYRNAHRNHLPGTGALFDTCDGNLSETFRK